MKKRTLIFIALICSITFSNSYANNKILTDKVGMTLYTFDKDNGDKSACYGSCAKKWPPVIEDMLAKTGWGSTTRKDDSEQWTFDGQPLYTWIGDSQPGDTNGDGIGGVWHAAHKDNVKSAKAKKKKPYDK